MRAAQIIGSATTRARPRWRDFLDLTKPRVVALMWFTVLVGMLLAPTAHVPWQQLLFGSAGIALVAAAAAALNHLVDRHLDAEMMRTRSRPMPRGALGAQEVAVFAAVLIAAGMALLLVFTNALCLALTAASLLGYALVYSLFLKHATPQNIVIGGAAGAAPPLLGWVAVSGSAEPGALLLFLIILIWTPPHFWALAIHRRDDYARAGVPMLPVTHGVPHTADRILQYTLALVAVASLPPLIGLAGWFYLAITMPLGLRFVMLARRLRHDVRLAMPTFRYSIVYLFGLFGALLVDRYGGWGG